MKFVVPLFCLLIAGCGYDLQTTSGSSYLGKYQNTPVHQNQPYFVATANKKNLTAVRDLSIDEKVRQVAAVEPVLSFPARIGIARIDHGQLSMIPDQEAEAWSKVKNNLGSSFGTFVPINPMVTRMVSQQVSYDGDIINTIRLGAARQHVDAVLIYETYSKNSDSSNFLSMADVTVIGAFILPSRTLEAEGFASALLIDVVQGYPYGTANVTLDKQEALASRWGWGTEKGAALAQSVRTKAAIKLSKEVEVLFRGLQKALIQKKNNT